MPYYLVLAWSKKLYIIWTHPLDHVSFSLEQLRLEFQLSRVQKLLIPRVVGGWLGGWLGGWWSSFEFNDQLKLKLGLIKLLPMILNFLFVCQTISWPTALLKSDKYRDISSSG